MTPFRPMLAATVTDSAALPFPLVASPKLDGVRALVRDGTVVSRNLKLIPNQAVQDLLGHSFLNGLDGELLVGDPTAADCFRVTTSAVMSVAGVPAVQLAVFDRWDLGGLPFKERFDAATDAVRGANAPVQLVPHELLPNLAALEAYEADALAKGYEGVMLRRPEGIYKHGRATAREGYLLKLKRFVDAEAVVVGTVEQLANENAATRNALGHLERSSHRANKRAKGCLGALVVRDRTTGREFEVGTGFTQAEREALWRARGELTGRVVKYKSQPTGVKAKPRFPVFLGFRDPVDI